MRLLAGVTVKHPRCNSSASNQSACKPGRTPRRTPPGPHRIGSFGHPDSMESGQERDRTILGRHEILSPFATGSSIDRLPRIRGTSNPPQTQRYARTKRRPADAQLLAGAQREAMAWLDALIAAKGVKRSAKNHAADVAFRPQPWPLERDLQRRRIGRIADQRVAQHQRATIRRAADGDAEAARARPAEIDDARVEARFQNDQAHANARIEMPRRSNAARRPRTKSRALGLSPWTHRVWIPCSAIRRWP